MSLTYSELFRPFKIGNVSIKNRIAMSPMRTGSRHAGDGNLTDEVIDYYEARARGGFGLIYTLGYPVSCGVEETYNSMDPFKNMALFKSTLGKLADKLHAYDAKMFVGIGSGAGRAIFPNMMTEKMHGQPVAPSAIPNRWNPDIICRPLTTQECNLIVKRQIEIATLLKDVGADGICIGGPYGGYLTDQFMTKVFNQRTDEYGYENHYGTKIVTDVIRGVREACGKRFAIDVRMSARHYMKGLNSAPLPNEEFTEFGRGIEDSVMMAKEFETAGADSIFIGNGSYDSFYWLYPPTYMPEGLWLKDAKAIRDAVSIPVICSGKINTPELANEAIKSGMVDCVALGRASLADPEWPNKARAGAADDIRPCIGCQAGCIGRNFRSENVTCAVNPQIFSEKSDPITPATNKKHIVVVGGGPGGMEAARVAALRGHEVDLFEKADHLGGLFYLASIPDFKQPDRKLIDWYRRALAHAGVKVHLNHSVDNNEIINMRPDAVIFATGASAKRIQFSGIEKIDAMTASDVLNGCKTGNRVVLIGGGLVGCETAVWLADQGKQVTIVEVLPSLMSAGLPTPTPNYLMMLDMLKSRGITVHISATVLSIEQGAVRIRDQFGEYCLTADTVVQAVGYAPDNSLYLDLEQNTPIPVWNIGDSKQPGNILCAVRDGFYVGKNI